MSRGYWDPPKWAELLMGAIGIVSALALLSLTGALIQIKTQLMASDVVIEANLKCPLPFTRGDIVRLAVAGESVMVLGKSQFACTYTVRDKYLTTRDVFAEEILRGPVRHTPVGAP